jgi:hypothetical protein
VATLKNLKYKIYFDLFNTFLVTTQFYVLFHSFDERETERETEKERDKRERETERETEKETDRETDRERETETERDKRERQRFYMCYFLVLMSSLLFYNVENPQSQLLIWPPFLPVLCCQ